MAARVGLPLAPTGMGDQCDGNIRVMRLLQLSYILLLSSVRCSAYHCRLCSKSASRCLACIASYVPNQLRGHQRRLPFGPASRFFKAKP